MTLIAFSNVVQTSGFLKLCSTSTDKDILAMHRIKLHTECDWELLSIYQIINISVVEKTLVILSEGKL